jgi:hypothetical protein
MELPFLFDLAHSVVKVFGYQWFYFPDKLRRQIERPHTGR